MLKGQTIMLGNQVTSLTIKRNWKKTFIIKQTSHLQKLISAWTSSKGIHQIIKWKRSITMIILLETHPEQFSKLSISKDNITEKTKVSAISIHLSRQPLQFQQMISLISAHQVAMETDPFCMHHIRSKQETNQRRIHFWHQQINLSLRKLNKNTLTNGIILIQIWIMLLLNKGKSSSLKITNWIQEHGDWKTMVSNQNWKKIFHKEEASMKLCSVKQ